MGAWGLGPFDNDDAADWVFDLEDDGTAALVAALDLDEGDLEAPDAAQAVAAAAVVAAACGLEVETSAEVDDWLAGADLAPVRALAAVATVALGRVLDGSELAELHDEAGNSAWAEDLTVLRSALGPHA